MTASKPDHPASGSPAWSPLRAIDLIAQLPAARLSAGAMLSGGGCVGRTEVVCRPGAHFRDEWPDGLQAPPAGHDTGGNESR
jgi:hypothetical protein